MVVRSHVARIAAAVGLVLLLASPSVADLEDQLARYTGDNATGYLQPVADAVGADLNSGLFHSADIPLAGLNFSFELQLTTATFADEDRTFEATTEGGFTPEQTADAPTVVGDGEAVVITGDGGSSYAFPGGFDLSSFSLVVPQLRVGSVLGTEGMVRFIAIETGDADLGDISLFGFGLRHSISQYLSPTFPVDVSAGFFWQTLTIGQNSAGDDLTSTSAFTYGVQASMKFGPVEPYAGLSMDSYTMDVTYESDEDEKVELTFDPGASVHLTLGAAVQLGFVTANAEYNIADQGGFALGLSFGN